jgi:hypothetical protein
MVDVNMVTGHELSINYHGTKLVPPRPTKNLQIKNSNNLANLAILIRHQLNGYISAYFLQTSEFEPGIAWTYVEFIWWEGIQSIWRISQCLVTSNSKEYFKILTRGLPIYYG